MRNVDIPPPGLQITQTAHPVAVFMDRLQQLAGQRGLTVFARIDFAADAAKAGMTMQPATLMLLGNPKAGTPLMVAAPSTAIDLPLKVLAWSDAAGATQLALNEPEFLQERHGFPSALLANIAGLAKLVALAAGSDGA
jgi:uncharacterized protein (DUF302 family)